VSNCNKNVQSVFKLSRENLIGKEVWQLYPDFIWEPMKSYFISFLKQNDPSVSEESFDNYFIDSKKNVFKALQSIKIISKSDGIYLLLLLFEK